MDEMRKEFITPSINVKSFSREVVLDDSTVTSNEELAKKELTDANVVEIQTVNVTW